jgi:hypothetical protein
MKKLDKIAKILEGIASIISLYPQKNKHKITLSTTSIRNSLKNDWEKIGLDMWQAYQTIEPPQLEEKQHRNDNDRLKRYPTKHC